MKKIILDLLKDKEGEFSLREIAAVLFVVLTALSWAVETFTSLTVPEYMFWAFMAVIGVAKAGYSYERPTKKGGG